MPNYDDVIATTARVMATPQRDERRTRSHGIPEITLSGSYGSSTSAWSEMVLTIGTDVYKLRRGVPYLNGERITRAEVPYRPDEEWELVTHPYNDVCLNGKPGYAKRDPRCH